MSTAPRVSRMVHMAGQRASIAGVSFEPEEIQPVVIAWFNDNARDLPWRPTVGPRPTPWGVLVSEVMLQQTPVPRVAPVWRTWMERWPCPADLADDPAAEAIRVWGRLGYPRRALRLHAAAGVMVERHGAGVPGTYEDLIALPGVGDYTAAAVMSFAFGGRAIVLDVNIRRLFARYFDGIAAPTAQVTKRERLRAESLLPRDGATWAAATMELGQVICTARNPQCGSCPLAASCSWLALGRPGQGERTTKRQTYDGTDRQARGVVIERLRDGAAARGELDILWHDPAQLDRALGSLLADGLVDLVADDRFALPGD